MLCKCLLKSATIFVWGIFCPLISVSEQKTTYTPFGTTLPLGGALHGRVYRLSVDTQKLPNFEMLPSISDLYTYTLDIRAQTYEVLYPPAIPVTEWFGIDYKGDIWIKKEGEFRFFLQSDDGANLYIDDVPVIDDDGLHPPTQLKRATVRMPLGLHRMRVSYFQGPATGVALVLAVQPPGEDIQIFDIRNFRPPGSQAHPSLQNRPK